MKPTFSTKEALELVKKGKEMRCISYGINCGFILVSDGEKIRFSFSHKNIEETHLDQKAKWIIH